MHASHDKLSCPRQSRRSRLPARFEHLTGVLFFGFRTMRWLSQRQRSTPSASSVCNPQVSLPMEVVVENLAVELTRCVVVGDSRATALGDLTEGVVVNDGRLTPVVGCVFTPGGIFKKTLAGGNWLMGGRIAGRFLSEELVAIDQRWDSVAVPRLHRRQPWGAVGARREEMQIWHSGQMRAIFMGCHYDDWAWV